MSQFNQLTIDLVGLNDFITFIVNLPYMRAFNTWAYSLGGSA